MKKTNSSAVSSATKTITGHVDIIQIQKGKYANLLSVYFPDQEMVAPLSVDPDGTVYQGDTVLDPCLNKKTGYIVVYPKWYDYSTLKRTGEPYRASHPLYVHRLVATRYIANPYHLPQVDHIDNNRSNNNLINLRWLSRKENNSRAKHGKLNARDWSHSILKVFHAGDPSSVHFFANEKKAAEFIGCSRVLVSYVINPNHYAKSAKGWKVELVEIAK